MKDCDTCECFDCPIDGTRYCRDCEECTDMKHYCSECSMKHNEIIISELDNEAD